MSWCPFVKKMELQPESDSQPAIVPDQFILHSIVAPWTPERTYEYWRDSTNLESHFGLGYDGRAAQFIGTQTRADANGVANRRADGHGAVSLESASNLQASDPWTDAQVDTIVRIGVWLHEEHAVPLRICRSWDDPGYGYHRLFREWNPDAHSCPGDARVDQFHDLVFPRIKNGETDMALSAEDKTWLTSLLTDKAYGATIGKDAVRSPDDAAANPTWTSASYLRESYLRLLEIRAQGASNGTVLSQINATLAIVKATLDSLDLENLPADVAAKLNGLKFVLEAQA